MLVKELIEEFSKIETLPIDLKDVERALRAKGVEDEIYYFHDLELDPDSFAGFLHREEIDYGNETRFISTITYAKLGEEMERLVCCKEMLHILDPDYHKSKSVKDVNDLVAKIILPAEFVDPPNDGDQINSDRIGIAHAIAILLPLASIEVFRPLLMAGRISSERIAEIAELPHFWVTLAMSDLWPRLHANLIKRYDRAVM